ncbi:MAG: hypothetical protein ACE5HI_01955 [bacterium]
MKTDTIQQAANITFDVLRKVINTRKDTAMENKQSALIQKDYSKAMFHSGEIWLCNALLNDLEYIQN